MLGLRNNWDASPTLLMTSDLTLDTLAFKLVYSDKNGSLRRETSRGATLPEELTIRHTTVIDNISKLSTRRSNVKLDRYMSVDGDGNTAPIVASLTVAVPQAGAAITSSDILAAVQRLITLLQEDDSGLDLMDEIFVNNEQ